MSSVRYVRVVEEKAAVDWKRQTPQAQFLAGGTNLVDLMAQGVAKPELLIDITSLPYQDIKVEPDGGVRLGALASNQEVAYHPFLAAQYPVLGQALRAGAAPQLRNAATVGGNLLQRTRCPYFRDPTFPCNKRQPGSGCPAISGYHRTHAILGASEHCIAVYPSDMAVALVALDALVQTSSPEGPRRFPLADLHLLPGETPDRETILQPHELITAIEIPSRPNQQSSYYKVYEGASHGFALVSAAIVLTVRRKIVQEARIVLGGVAAKPWRCGEAERLLKGRMLHPSTILTVAEAALQGAKAYPQNQFKIELAKRSVRTVLTQWGELL